MPLGLTKKTLKISKRTDLFIGKSRICLNFTSFKLRRYFKAFKTVLVWNQHFCLEISDVKLKGLDRKKSQKNISNGQFSLFSFTN